MLVASILETTLLKSARSLITDETTISLQLSIYSKDVNFQHLIIQLKMLPDLIHTYNEQNPKTRIKEVTKFFLFISNYGRVY